MALPFWNNASPTATNKPRMSVGKSKTITVNGSP